MTIKDVAREAGVNVSTASRALLGRYGVHESTRETVLRIAERLNYHANPIAQGLVTGRSNTIGLLVSDIRNPFFSEVARGVEDAAQAAGCQVFLCNSDLDATKQIRNFRALRARCVDGVIMNSISNLDTVHQKELTDAHIPVVLLNCPPESPTTFCTLIADNFRGGYLAGEYLTALGHRSIGHVTGPRGHGNLSQRAKGFLKACETVGRVASPTVLHGEHSYAGGYKLAKRLLSRNPAITAIFAGNDMMAFGVARALIEMGLRVPGDVSVIGFDDIEFANVVSPPLTTIHQPKYEMGQAAVQMLLATSSVPEHRVFGVRLIERQSCQHLNGDGIPGNSNERPLVTANAKEGKSATPVSKLLSLQAPA